MKKALAISLALFMLSMSVKDLLTYAHYRMNKTYIAQTLCENRDKPEMACEGKCFLKKALQDNQKEENEAPNSKEKNAETLYCSYSFFICLKALFISDEKEKIAFLTNGYLFTLYKKVFHPPPACLRS